MRSYYPIDYLCARPARVWDSKVVSLKAPAELSSEVGLIDCFSRRSKHGDSGIHKVFAHSPSELSLDFEETFDASYRGDQSAIRNLRGFGLLKSERLQLLGNLDGGEVTGDVVVRLPSAVFKGQMKQNVIVSGSLWLCGHRPMRLDIENTWFQLETVVCEAKAKQPKSYGYGRYRKKRAAPKARKPRKLLHCKGQLVTGYGLVQSGTFKCEYNPKDDTRLYYTRMGLTCNVLLTTLEAQIDSKWQFISGRICSVYALKAEDSLWKRIELKAKNPTFWLDCTTVPTLDTDSAEKKATLFSGQLIVFDETLLRLLNLPVFVCKDWVYMGTFELAVDFYKFARFVAPSGHCRIFDASGKCMYDCKLSKNNANLLKGNLKKCFKGKGKMKRLQTHMTLLPQASFK